jgi:hypothetical protein
MSSALMAGPDTKLLVVLLLAAAAAFDSEASWKEAPPAWPQAPGRETSTSWQTATQRLR